MTNSTEELRPEEIHDVLRNERRRAVLSELRQNGGNHTVRDLAERIAELESNESPAPRNVRQSVYVSLHQTHLPKLDDLEIVAYDTDDQAVEMCERAKQVEAYMDGSPGSEATWGVRYLGLGLLGLGGTIVLGFEFLSFSPIDVVVWATVGFLLLTLAALYQLQDGQLTDVLS